MAHLSEQKIQKYCRRTLTSEERGEVDAHLADCDACRTAVQRAERLQVIDGFWQRALESEEETQAHPLPEEIAAAILGAGTPLSREIVEDHLQVCRQCAAVVRDLRQFQRNPEAYMNAASDIAGRPVEAERRTAWWLPLMRFATPALAFSVVVALLFVVRFRQELRTMQQANARLAMRIHTLDADAHRYAELSSGMARQAAQAKEMSHQLEQALKQEQSALAQLQKQTALLRRQPESDRSALPDFVAKALQHPELAPEKDLMGTTGTLAGGGEPTARFALLSPVATATLSPRPTFRWNALEGAISYRVTVMSPDFNVVADSGLLKESDPQWQQTMALLPRNERSWLPPHLLPQDVPLTWHVTAIREGKEIVMPSPEQGPAKFKVLTSKQSSALRLQIQALRKQYHDSAMALGILYRSAALREEAEKEFQKLVDADPHSPLPRKLLLSVRSPHPTGKPY